MGKIKDFDTEKILKENNISGLDDLEMRILRFRRELANIGEIDELTLKEAKETEDRYQFLSQQSEDLIKAKADLEKIIAELTERIDTQFNESLKIINDEFNKYFRMIFGGGRAKLSVIKMPKASAKRKNEENNRRRKNKLKEVEAIKVEEERSEENEEEQEFETGIEISVDLPRKKLRVLNYYQAESAVCFLLAFYLLLFQQCSRPLWYLMKLMRRLTKQMRVFLQNFSPISLIQLNLLL